MKSINYGIQKFGQYTFVSVMDSAQKKANIGGQNLI
jgi:hypothetical protein